MTNKEKVVYYIKENYGAMPEHLWAKFPTYAVFRHKSNNKWFALVANIKRTQLGLEGNEDVEIINLKGDAVINGSLMLTKGIYPGYHMNKQTWLSVLLDGSVSFDLICELIDMSYENTKTKSRH